MKDPITDPIKDAVRAEKAMNEALRRQKASGGAKKQAPAPKAMVVAEKV